MFNVDFNPALMEYTQDYENSLHFSSRFQEYAARLAGRLIERYDLHGKKIIEIGCGKGDFLKLLCDLGDNQGLGFDPSYVPDKREPAGPVTFVQEFYSERFVGHQVDFICCRHVLEHIERPGQFMAMVRRTLGSRSKGIVFFEVPNVLFTLHQLGIWDIIYEHCSYFSPYSLSRLFRRSGFQVLSLEPAFGGQFLTIEARPAQPMDDESAAQISDLRQMAQAVTGFADRYHQHVTSWTAKLEAMASQGMRMVIWGAGSKGVMFANALKTTRMIDYMVDINPRKSGMYAAGTGQQIVPPEFLQTYQPDLVIIMNANYQPEIKSCLRTLDVTAEVIVA